MQFPEGLRQTMAYLDKNKKPKGIVDSVAGSWENRPEIVEEALRLRDEDNEYGIIKIKHRKLPDFNRTARRKNRRDTNDRSQRSSPTSA